MSTPTFLQRFGNFGMQKSQKSKNAKTPQNAPKMDL